MSIAAKETMDGSESAIEVANDGAVFVYQREAGGFSHIYDSDANDWVSFTPGTPTAPEGAANVFRGMPNLVHPENLGHPGYDGCVSTVVRAEPGVTIHTTSRDGVWGWDLRFTDSAAWIDVRRVPSERAYWFLYEGTPGGRYDPSGAFWGTPAGRASIAEFPGCTLRPLEPFVDPGWAYFGHRSSPRVLFCAHCRPSGTPTTLYFMNARKTIDDRTASEDGMVVFGFGRGPGVEKHLRGPHRFAVGMLETTRHDQIVQGIENALREDPLRSEDEE